MATLKDLSRQLGLSVTQVSRALNDHDDVSASTKARVRDAAKALNYRPNIMARRLVTGRSGIVGLIWHQGLAPSEGWVFAQVVGGLSVEFNRLGMQFMLNMADDERAALDSYDRLIASRSIDGFVVIFPQFRDRRVELLRARGVPFVLHGRTQGDPDYAFYDIDNEAVGYDLTAHLLRHGHRDVAFINGPDGASFARSRFEGYQRALAEAGLTPLRRFHVGGRMSTEFGHLETIRLFQAKAPKPTALIAGNMLIAKGIISACVTLGLAIPGDISLVAHDDGLLDPKAEGSQQALTSTVSIQREAWGELAKRLVAVIGGESPRSAQEIGPHGFVEGQSVRQI